VIRAATGLLVFTLGTLAAAPEGLAATTATADAGPDRGRRAPASVPVDGLDVPHLATMAVPLREAAMSLDPQRAQVEIQSTADGGWHERRFAPGRVLVKFRQAPGVAVLGVEIRRERVSLDRLCARPDVEFAELDWLQERQFTPTDPLVGDQWHHGVIDSYRAWEVSQGSLTLQIAMVDDPFQLDHPDLAANVAAGWSVVSNAVITSSSGSDHATLAAGLAAAVLDNQLGVAGVGNCRVLPVHVNGFTSEIYAAVVWAADHGLRVVNVSWSGADSPTLNDAGAYLRQQTEGLLVMAGVNGTGWLDYPDYPDLWCVSMTDAAQNLRSRYGDHIDFAAPGYEVYSTTVSSAYASGTGTSYAAPLVSGVIAVLFSINPLLDSAAVIDILRTTAEDLGPVGRDRFFGWGEIRFGRAVAAAQATLPRITEVVREADRVRVTVGSQPGLQYRLWKANHLAGGEWLVVTNATVELGADQVRLTDPAPMAAPAFYRVQAERGAPAGPR
jgi:subtilisin family serine protease